MDRIMDFSSVDIQWEIMIFCGLVRIAALRHVY